MFINEASGVYDVKKAGGVNGNISAPGTAMANLL